MPLPTRCSVPPVQSKPKTQRAAISAVERLTHNVLRGLAEVVACAADEACQEGGGKPRLPAAVLLSEPCHSLVQEDGDFAASSDRVRRLSFGGSELRRMARLWAALDAVHRLNCQGRTATQRELFYRALAEGRLFASQSVMDQALRDCVGALRLGRPQLGIFTAEKGLLAGDIAFCDPSRVASVAAQGASGTSIGESMLSHDQTIQVGSKAQFVLVVEKDTVFQHLLHSQLLATLPLILVTGRGYPDILTRRFLQRLQRIAPHLPQLYLGDYDPDGVAIFLLYRTSCAHLRWLGLHQEDVKKLPDRAGIALSTRDRALRASLLRREELQTQPALAEQVRSMTSKFELEALHATYAGEGMALQFIPEKVKLQAWI